MGEEPKPKIKVKPDIWDVPNNAPYLTSLPVIPVAAAPYTPILYTFRVTKPRKNRNTRVKNIPFYVQLDQCIPVIWSIFNAAEASRSLGITQLEWALSFLYNVHTERGVRPKTVEVCIEAIHDTLINYYADMSEILNVFDVMDEKASDDDKRDKPSFSVNYADIMKTYKNKPKVFCKCVLSDPDLIKEIDNIKKAAGIGVEPAANLTDSVSKEKAINVLNDWKKKQVDKILNEFEVLRCIEDTIKTTDADKFEGYLDEKTFEHIFTRVKQ